MTVKVEREVEDFGFKYRENCCKCGTPTQYWYTANDVACCPPCAEVSEPEDMPWGARVFRVRDPDGFQWVIARPLAA